MLSTGFALWFGCGVLAATILLIYDRKKCHQLDSHEYGKFMRLTLMAIVGLTVLLGPVSLLVVMVCIAMEAREDD